VSRRLGRTTDPREPDSRPAAPRAKPLPQAIGNRAFTRLVARRGMSSGRGPQHGRGVGGSGPRLFVGSRGSDVADLRQFLRIVGHDVTDGDAFDEQTLQAVMRFQQRHGIAAYGVVEEQTWRALKREVAAASTERSPRRPYPGPVKG
jgi:hypothetical protein